MVICQSANQIKSPAIFPEPSKWSLSLEKKDAQPSERTAALWGLSNKIDSLIWVNFKRNGLRLESRHQEPPHTEVSRNLATVVIRGVLLGLRRRRTGLLPSGPKPSFQMRASFVFHLETWLVLCWVMPRKSRICLRVRMLKLNPLNPPALHMKSCWRLWNTPR